MDLYVLMTMCIADDKAMYELHNNVNIMQQIRSCGSTGSHVMKMDTSTPALKVFKVIPTDGREDEGLLYVGMIQ